MSDTTDRDYDLAFKLLHDASEKLKKRGLDAGETWALLFNVIQDLQAADFGMGSDEHHGHIQAQCASLRDALTEWDDAPGVH